MDSEGVKKAVMRQALQETTTTNVQILMDVRGRPSLSTVGRRRPRSLADVCGRP